MKIVRNAPYHRAHTQQASKTAWQRWQNAIVAVSLLSVSAMVGGVSYYFHHLDRLVTQQESENRHLMARLKEQIPSPLKGQVSLLSQKVAQQQRDLQALAALDDLNGQGFSDWLTALGQSMTGEIQVTNFTLNGEKVALDGFAKHSDSVPSWIAQFPHFSALKSTDLQGLTLNRDEKGRLQFSLTSEAK